MQYSDIKLQRSESMPLFLQLAGELKKVIAQTDLDCQEKLISERKLAGLLQVNRLTVRKAYDELLREGIVTSSSVRVRRISPAGRRKHIMPLPCIGVILPYEFSRIVDEDHQIALRYFKGIIDRASAENIAVIMLQLPDANTPVNIVRTFIRETVNHLSGIIHIGDRKMYPDTVLQKIMRLTQLPQVIISADSQYPNLMQVVPDIDFGACELAEKLVSLGLKKVGVVSFYDRWKPKIPTVYVANRALSRSMVFRDIFRRYQLDCDDRFCLFGCCTYSDMLRNLLLAQKNGNLPEVYWCQNDEVASWLLRACREIGLSVPEDISVVGFDGLDLPEAPGLATVQMPFYEIGVLASEVVFEAMKTGEFSSREFRVKTRFVSGNTLKNNNN